MDFHYQYTVLTHDNIEEGIACQEELNEIIEDVKTLLRIKTNPQPTLEDSTLFLMLDKDGQGIVYRKITNPDYLNNWVTDK